MRSRLNSVAWITSLIAAGIAIVITIVIPTGYFLVSHQYMMGALDTQAELAAKTTERLVMANPNTWRFEEIRLQELMQRYHDPEIPQLRSIVDSYGNVIAHVTEPVSEPIVMRRSDIYDAGNIVGHVEISRSLRPLLIRTALIFAVSLLMGSCIFLILRVIPLRALRAEQLKSQKIEIQSRQLQKAESLARMAGAIAHHFNNKLGVVMGNLELALLDAGANQKLSTRLLEAQHASAQAAEVSSLMLAYLGQGLPKGETLDLAKVCRELVETQRSFIPKRVTLKINIPPHGPTIKANKALVRQILSNLIVNAWEAIGESEGDIQVSLRVLNAVETSSLNVSPADWKPESDHYACVEVADTGCGINLEQLDLVFDPFFSTKFTGRGLGLAVVLGTVRSHGGAVAVDSEPGRGSIFRVFWPVAEPEAQTLQKTDAGIARPIEGLGLVLFVDDEDQLRNMAEMMLGSLGFEVVQASHGLEALEIFRMCKDEINLVILDLTMPGMSGWETLEALRALRRDIPVVLASGYDEATVMEGTHAELPQAFLHKPYSMAHLKAALGAAVEKSSAESMKCD
jgi:signal transduction histidine kinase/ActR/RegA family two-component response regulator